MADILIRKLSDDAKERFAEAAARAGSSLEAFLRSFLEAQAAALPRPSNDAGMPMAAWIAQLFADIDPESREAFADALDHLPYEVEELVDPFVKSGKDA